jgi:hypothetical protein
MKNPLCLIEIITCLLQLQLSIGKVNTGGYPSLKSCVNSIVEVCGNLKLIFP